MFTPDFDGSKFIQGFKPDVQQTETIQKFKEVYTDIRKNITTVVKNIRDTAPSSPKSSPHHYSLKLEIIHAIQNFDVIPRTWGVTGGDKAQIWQIVKFFATKKNAQYFIILFIDMVLGLLLYSIFFGFKYPNPNDVVNKYDNNGMPHSMAGKPYWYDALGIETGMWTKESIELYHSVTQLIINLHNLLHQLTEDKNAPYYAGFLTAFKIWKKSTLLNETIQSDTYRSLTSAIKFFKKCNCEQLEEKDEFKCMCENEKNGTTAHIWNHNFPMHSFPSLSKWTKETNE
jgi:hypothetical protein